MRQTTTRSIVRQCASLGERPSGYTVAAGLVLLCTLAGHECAAMREAAADADLGTAQWYTDTG